jgi:iron complex transport system ATP-binding protein
MSEGYNGIISTEGLEIGFAAKGARSRSTVVAGNINVKLHSGEVVCLLGPNGSGKSTLIRTLAGLHPKLDGNISLYGQDLTGFTIKDIAKKVSTVLTDRVTVGNLSVYELVSFGRSPYTGWLGELKPEDRESVEWAIEATGINKFVDRDILRLSDGERQKVMMARASEQDTSTILLDEPTAHLDLPNRVEIIRLLRELAHETKKGILLSTHELDLALKAADTLWLISTNGKLVTGTPEDLVLDGTFESVFRQDSFDFDRSTGSFKLHQPAKEPIYLTGSTVPVFWTRRALEREGYKVTESNGTQLQIDVEPEQDGFVWKVSNGSIAFSCKSIKDLLNQLRHKI